MNDIKNKFNIFIIYPMKIIIIIFLDSLNNLIGELKDINQEEIQQEIKKVNINYFTQNL